MKQKRLGFAAAALAVCVALLSNTVFAEIPWDGYVEDDSGVVIVDMDNYGTIMRGGAEPSQKYVKTAKYSACWKNQAQNVTLSFPVVRDWSAYSTMEFWMYSAKKTNSSFIMCVMCDPTSSGEISYYSYTGVVNWEGWQKFSLPLLGDSLVKNRDADYTAVNSLEFNSAGWGLVPNSETELYIDSVVLKKETEGLDVNMFPVESRELADSIMEQTVAVYDGCKMAYRGGEQIPLNAKDEQAVCRYENGDWFVPTSLFETFEGVSAAKNGSAVTVTRGDKSVVFTEGAAEYRVAGATKTLAAPLGKDGYLPFIAVCEAIGLNCFTDGKLAVAGTAQNLEEMKKDPTAAEYIKYCATYQKVDPKSITAEDFAQFRKKWVAYRVGDENNDLSNEQVKAKLQAIEQSGNASWNALKENGYDGKRNPWTGQEVTSEQQMNAMYGELHAMAMAYAAPGCALYHDKALEKDILTALEWLNQNYFGDSEIAGTGWAKIRSGNWWYWEIGAPKDLVEVLMYMQDVVSKKDAKKYLRIVDYMVPNVRATGANRIDWTQIVLGASALEEDAERLIRARDSLDFTFVYATPGQGEAGEGFYRDGTYLFHWQFPLNGSYGEVHFKGVLPLLALLEDTKFAVTNPNRYNIIQMYYDTIQPFVYDGVVMEMMTGRAATRSGSSQAAAASLVRSALNLMNFADETDRQLLGSYIKRQMKNETLSKSLRSELKLGELSQLETLLNDDTIAPLESYQIGRVLGRGDRAVFQRDDYAFGIAMSSSRIFNYEAMNDENKKGWYTGDGMVYYYNNDPSQYDGIYWSSVNPYRLPGTTVDTQERAAINSDVYLAYLSSKDFVGGVTDGKYGAAAMWLESFHSDEDREYNGVVLPKHDCSLEAKKSWFAFDDELVALGADIHSQDDVHALTIVDNRKSRDTQMLENNSSEVYEIVGVTASDEPQEENPKDAAIDGDLSTRWSAEGDQWLQLDLGEVKTVGYAELAFANGDARTASFDLLVSADGENWKKVYSGESSGKTLQMEAYPLKNEQARYVRVLGHGNSSNRWNSITEVNVHAAVANGNTSFESVYSGTETVTVDGAKKDVGKEETTYSNISWAHLSDTCGYYFPQTETVQMAKTPGNPSFFEMWIDHGEKPQDEKYAYVLLPGRTAEQTAAYAANADVEILSNTAKLQAVRENKCGITQMVFWEAGTCGEVTVNVPLIVQVRKENDNLFVSVADPTHKLSSATVTLTGGYGLVSGDDAIAVQSGANATTLTADLSGAAGASFTVCLSKNARN